MGAPAGGRRCIGAAIVDVCSHQGGQAPSQGFVALHAGVLPVLNVVHVEAAAGVEAGTAVEVGHVHAAGVQRLHRGEQVSFRYDNHE